MRALDDLRVVELGARVSAPYCARLFADLGPPHRGLVRVQHGVATSGGVLGKMVSPQNLAIAAGAVGVAGREGDIFRKVIGWSLGLLVLMCVLVGLQATPVLSWMVPGS